MNENFFDFENDAELSALVGALPPTDEITQKVSPWRNATRKLLSGFALTAVVPQIFPLNLIFPVAGSILLFLGFRSLRKENKSFFLGFILSCIIFGFECVSVLLNSSLIGHISQSSAPVTVMAMISLLLILLTAVSISFGFWEVKKKLEYSGSNLSTFALVGIMGLICFLALINFTGVLATFVLVAYALVFVALNKLSKELDEIGYSIRIAQSKTSDKSVIAICLSVFVAISLTGYVFFSRYPMEWTPQVKTEDMGIEEIKDNLLSVGFSEDAQIDEIKYNLLFLGFPEDVLSDLKNEDILKCKNASFVTVNRDLQAFNNGRKVSETKGNITHIHTEYDEEEMQFTSITVLVDEEKNEWKVFHHFKWVIDKGYYGAEGISLEPYSGEHGKPDEPSGQVLYDMDGITYTSPFLNEGEQTYKSTSILNSGETMNMYFAEFSYPSKSQAKRGYVTYNITFYDDVLAVNSILCYAHNKTPLQYPVKSATQVLKEVESDTLSYARRYDIATIDTGDYYLKKP